MPSAFLVKEVRSSNVQWETNLWAEEERKGTFSKPSEQKKRGGRENITLHNPSEQLRKKEGSSKYSRINFREKEWNEIYDEFIFRTYNSRNLPPWRKFDHRSLTRNFARRKIGGASWSNFVDEHNRLIIRRRRNT